MLKLAKEVLQKTFKVIVLKQDLAKTRRLIKSLSAAGIDMEIIPEYSLSHTIEQGNKAAIATWIQSSRGKHEKNQSIENNRRMRQS
jgi:hypothetical protein